MPANASQMQAGNSTDPRQKATGKLRLLTLGHLDGRTTAAKRAHDLIDSVTADLGGLDRLATGERQIVQRAAMIGTMAEDIEARWLLGEPIDATVLCTLANAQRRLFEAVGLSRRSRTIVQPLAEYLATQAEAE